MKLKKHLAWLLVFTMLLSIVPVEQAEAASGKTCLSVEISWYGDPTPIEVVILEQVGAGAYTTLVSATIYPQYYSENENIKCWVGHFATYDYDLQDTNNQPFCAIKRASVDGKWYVDNWNWNNWVYQPGQYMGGSGGWSSDGSYEASFFLTCSETANNTITINRNWAAGTPAEEVIFEVFRKFSYNDEIGIVKKVTLPKEQNSVVVSGLYSGEYYVSQILPFYYNDDSDINFGRAGKRVTVSGNATVSFTDTYAPPLKYNVSVSALASGTITPDKTQAMQGDTVSLTVTPGSDMQLKSGTLQYNDGSDHVISGTSFTMPATDVTVSAEFEPKEYTVSIGTLSGGSITASPRLLSAGGTVELTIIPGEGKQLKAGTLKYNDGTSDVPIEGTSFLMPKSNVTVSAQFEVPLLLTTDSLPTGMVGVPYHTTLTAQDGTGPYVFSAVNLPAGLTVDSSTGIISGTPTEAGNFDFKIKVNDASGNEATQTLTLKIMATCGNGGFLITPDPDVVYTAGMTVDGLPTITVNSGISGFRYFSVSVKKEKGHDGKEVLLFVHMRNGQQIGINATRADFDTIDFAQAAFNVHAGDVIKVYIVDGLTNDAGVNPAVL